MVAPLYDLTVLLATSNLIEWKTKWKLKTAKKTDLNQQRLFQMFDLVCAGFILFICNVILYRIIETCTTACKIDPN